MIKGNWGKERIHVLGEKQKMLVYVRKGSMIFLKIKYHLHKFVFGGVLTFFCLKMRLSGKEGKGTALTEFPREHLQHV